MNQGDNFLLKNRQPPGRSGAMILLMVAIVLLALVAAAAISGDTLLAWVATFGRATPALKPDTTDAQTFAAQRSQEQDVLNGYGWVDQTAGVVHIPIAAAMQQVANAGLPVGVPPTPTPAADVAAAAEPIAPAGISFQQNVLPIFVQHCSECHGADDPEEGLQLTSYKSVMLGSIYGAVIKPGDVEGSYLAKMVREGKMPKKGDPLTQGEVEIILAWIEAGAVDDVGAPPNEGSVQGATTNPAAISETISFAEDVLPIFVEHCSECHGQDDPEEGLELTSYRTALLGSIYGAVIKPGDAEGSYLIEMVSSGKMPKKGDPLTAQQIETIRGWVQAGALDN